MVALNVTKKAVANSNIENPHYQSTANGPVRARRFSVVSSPGKMVSSPKKSGAGDGPQVLQQRPERSFVPSKAPGQHA
jgi:hypothetical protein